MADSWYVMIKADELLLKEMGELRQIMIFFIILIIYAMATCWFGFNCLLVFILTQNKNVFNVVVNILHLLL